MESKLDQPINTTIPSDNSAFNTLTIQCRSDYQNDLPSDRSEPNCYEPDATISDPDLDPFNVQSFMSCWHTIQPMDEKYKCLSRLLHFIAILFHFAIAWLILIIPSYGLLGSGNTDSKYRIECLWFNIPSILAGILNVIISGSVLISASTFSHTYSFEISRSDILKIIAWHNRIWIFITINIIFVIISCITLFTIVLNGGNIGAILLNNVTSLVDNMACIYPKGSTLSARVPVIIIFCYFALSPLQYIFAYLDQKRLNKELNNLISRSLDKLRRNSY